MDECWGEPSALPQSHCLQWSSLPLISLCHELKEASASLQHLVLPPHSSAGLSCYLVLGWGHPAHSSPVPLLILHVYIWLHTLRRRANTQPQHPPPFPRHWPDSLEGQQSGLTGQVLSLLLPRGGPWLSQPHSQDFCPG